MQNRPSSEYIITPSEFTFDPDFPVDLNEGFHKVGDQNISMLHFHNGLELGYCYKGSGVFFVNNKIIPFYKSNVSIIFENEVHIAKSHKENISEWKFITIDVERLLANASLKNLAPISRIIFGSNSFQNIVNHDDHPDIVELVYQIISEADSKLEGYKTAVTGLILALMGKLLRLVHTDSINPEPDTNKTRLALISPALNYLSRYYAEKITIEQLAKQCNLSATHFRRVFNSIMKIQPMEYLFQVRMKMAIILLSDPSYSIVEVAMQVGYSSISSFNRHFKRIVGGTPKEYRS